MKFDGYLLVSDMDNTLLNTKHKVSDENRRAIDYFVNNGGKFTIATGRTVPAATEHIESLNINAPAILYNGAKIYDFGNGETLFEKFIDDSRKDAVRIMRDKYPFLGFEVYCEETAYVYRECKYTSRLKRRKYPAVYELPDEIWGKPWMKVLMIGDKRVLNKYIPEYKSYDGGYCVRSGDHFFDIVADGVSKGGALKTLAKILNIDDNKIIAAGDNMNDIDLLSAAGTSYAVENAEEAVKAAADLSAPHCNENALAWIIENIEKSKNVD